MKEVTFIRRNIEKWKETEKVVEKADKFNPDRLADAYTELTADLAFAQTHYPSSRITIYLNNLAFALQLKDTMILFSVMPKNIGISSEPLYTAIGSPLAIFSSVIST